MPLLYSLLELSGAVTSEPTQWVVGDALPNAAIATQPGIVEITDGGRLRRIAVNLDANESRTAPLSTDELERLGVPVAQRAPDAAAATNTTALLQGAEAEGRQKLWRWFLVAALAVLLFESALAGWTARRATLKPEEATP